MPNILKTIEPLFLDGIREQLDAGFASVKKLEALLERISAIKVFDPACGSGNFLVIAYKELRKVEHAILERLAELSPKHQVLFAESKINIENFYGIEIDDFAVEVAILSLWIAKHQMNTEFREKFNVSIPLIPLREAGQIQAGNATRVDWNSVCPNDGGEIYLIGNPPYVGSSMQSPAQKSDFPTVFAGRPFSKNLDYIALWFVKGADYLRGTKAQLAFVTTNSVAQGDHVGLMFPTVLTDGVEIGFAYTSFKWENNAKRNAGVTVAVIGLRNTSHAPKYLYTDGIQLSAANINGYLADGSDIIVTRARQPISADLPSMVFGSKPTDGGGLLLTPAEMEELLAAAPDARRWIRRFAGATEAINGGERYCLWIPDEEAKAAAQIRSISDRLARVVASRLAVDASDVAKKFASQPHRFVQRSYKPTESIIVPSVSSVRRAYIPFGYLGPDTVVSNLAYAVYDAQPWTFALLTSAMHMAWARAIGGRMKTDYRYSNTIVYNNFPVPELSDATKELFTAAALRVLDVREYHCERTLAELYDPDLMPADLREAHAEVDALVDSIYSKRGYETDEERLSDLFALYEEMAAAEAATAPAKKTRGARK